MYDMKKIVLSLNPKVTVSLMKMEIWYSVSLVLEIIENPINKSIY